MIRIAALVEIWICVERINAMVTDKLLHRLTELPNVVDATDAPRGSHTQRQNRQQKRRQNSKDGDDRQKFNQSERWLSIPALSKHNGFGQFNGQKLT